VSGLLTHNQGSDDWKNNSPALYSSNQANNHDVTSKALIMSQCNLSKPASAQVKPKRAYNKRKAANPHPKMSEKRRKARQLSSSSPGMDREDQLSPDLPIWHGFIPLINLLPNEADFAVLYSAPLILYDNKPQSSKQKRFLLQINLSNVSSYYIDFDCVSQRTFASTQVHQQRFNCSNSLIQQLDHNIVLKIEEVNASKKLIGKKFDAFKYYKCAETSDKHCNLRFAFHSLKEPKGAIYRLSLLTHNNNNKALANSSQDDKYPTIPIEVEREYCSISSKNDSEAAVQFIVRYPAAQRKELFCAFTNDFQQILPLTSVEYKEMQNEGENPILISEIINISTDENHISPALSFHTPIDSSLPDLTPANIAYEEHYLDSLEENYSEEYSGSLYDCSASACLSSLDEDIGLYRNNHSYTLLPPQPHHSYAKSDNYEENAEFSFNPPGAGSLFDQFSTL
jgi:hypothetical protein